MRIRGLAIENFRSIRYVKIENVGESILIAGPNGCGKTQIYNAIRLLKSVYGEYQPHELKQWFDESNIRFDKSMDGIDRLFQDTSKPIRISAKFELTDGERDFLRTGSERHVRSRAWESLEPGIHSETNEIRPSSSLAQQQRTHGEEVDEIVKDTLSDLKLLLQEETLHADLYIEPVGFSEASALHSLFKLKANSALELLFATYSPGDLGIVDYHGAQRNYNRQQIGSINLSDKSFKDTQKQHALYNWQNKYSNIKSELASEYIRSLISGQNGQDLGSSDSLSETLSELFSKFFPGKKFSGPIPNPNGTLDFPVKLESGAKHDIDDLSSGEKELLFGYLRLRNSAPRNSILLIDEPEIHLNPALLPGLAEFYQKHIGEKLENQLWLTTHSDTLFRDAIGQSGFTVFHMQSAEDNKNVDNQLHVVRSDDPIDRAIADLVGVTYRPHGKIVFLEGEHYSADGNGSGFDIEMTTKLFPQFAKGVNIVPARERSRVERLHKLVAQAVGGDNKEIKIFSIVDKDTELGGIEENGNVFKWDRYHIENYLLEPNYILMAFKELGFSEPGFRTEEEIKSKLLGCARDVLPWLVGHEMEYSTNKSIVSLINTKTTRKIDQIATELSVKLDESLKNLKDAMDQDFSLSKMKKKEKIEKNRLSQYLKGDEWVCEFPGRKTLQNFTEEINRVRKRNLHYEDLRRTILNRMEEANFEPPGMADVIQQILDA